MAENRFFLFGSPRIEINGHPIHVDTRKAIALLAYLALTSHAHQRDVLAALFWPETDQAHALGALRRTLSALKKSLGNQCLDIARDSIGLSADLCLWVDTQEFKALTQQVRDHPHASLAACFECLSHLDDALELYRDDFMAGFSLKDSPGFDDWQFFQAGSLRKDLAEVLQSLVLLNTQKGDYDTAITYARRWLNQDMLREEAHQLLMKLYAWSGQRNAALRQYRECVRILEKELSVPPLDETTELYQSILEGSLPYPRGEFVYSPSEVNIDVVKTEQETKIPPHQIRFVGRTWELDMIMKAYFNQRQQGYFMVIEGETGIGKTRLAEEFIEISQRNGARVIKTQCFPGESHLAYGPFIEGLRGCVRGGMNEVDVVDFPLQWLAELGRIYPDLVHNISPADIVPAPEVHGSPLNFYEAIRQLILKICIPTAGTTPANGVLVIDDLQWADDATIKLLTYITRRLPGTPLFILVTYRSTDLPQGHPIRSLVVETTRAGFGEVIKLDPFTKTDISRLVEAVFDETQIDPNLAEKLYIESEGLPLIAVEYLANLNEQVPEVKSGDWSLPGRVRDIICSRLAELEEPANQILSTAAVIGRSFDLYTLRSASGRSEIETIKGLEILIARGIIRERELDDPSEVIRYDFQHEKIREVAYEEISLARRRMLHKRVATAIQMDPRNQSTKGAVAGKIARQYHLAGDDMQAAVFYKTAGDYDRRIYANAEAMAHFQKALALDHPDKAGLHESIGDLQTLLGEYHAAITSYETAAALLEGQMHRDLVGDRNLVLSRLEHKMGSVYHRLGMWDLAVCYFESAQSDIEQAEMDTDLTHLYADWSRTLQMMGESSKARLLAEKSLSLAKKSKIPLSLAQAHNILGIIERSQNNTEAACNHLEASVDASRQAQNSEQLVAALNNLALASADLGNLDRAISLVHEALDICTRLGDRHLEAALLNNLADFLHDRGETEIAVEYLKKAVTIFAEVGVDSGSQRPEIWKLSTW